MLDKQKQEEAKAWLAGLFAVVGFAAVFLLILRGCGSTNSNLADRMAHLEEKVEELRLQTEYIIDLDLKKDYQLLNALVDGMELRAARTKALKEHGLEPSNLKPDLSPEHRRKVLYHAEQQRIRKENSKSGGWTPEDEEDPYENDEDESDNEDWEDE